MKRLARYARYFWAATAFWAAVFAVVILLKPTNWRLCAVTALAITLITALCCVIARKKLKAARLIVENQILYIQPAVIKEQESVKGTDFLPRGSIEVFISCFGILINLKIIKFNQQGVRLKAVELGQDYISLTYGTDRKTHSTKLLHSKISDDVITEISRKFFYETGITPSITH